ncbi:pseudouridine synthase [Thalassotalea agarivorans]|uniref:Pseudouridine synthase n=1 Tax=Thalassotalea agarivorans TaxID=349064 RepID=A0A1I0DF43_THASX|nr:pseudouridine synthase [Thalassotalea agarivorans]SET30777.1 ribosomal small subunit pseudouridine synthase A [Thalassotalea agarivorans]
MRLDKYICKSTELSRNEAKKLLKSGKVTLNGAVEKVPTVKVAETDRVAIEGFNLSVRDTRYIMMYKPLDTICSNKDELYPSILNFLDIDKAFDLNIAGRLDADTTGLVLLTDDGVWMHNIISPKKLCPKRYRVWLDEPLVADAEESFKRGIQLRGENQLTKPATLERISDSEVLLTIIEGKYHQVKRMFAALGNHVNALHREQIGEIVLDIDLEPGEWRALTEQEIASVS